MSNPVTNAHLFGIGHIVYRWANLETYLITILTHLMQTDDVRGMLVTAELGYNARRDLFRVLVEILKIHDDIEKEFDCLITRMDAAYSLRNTVAHSTWGKGDKPNTIKANVIKARGKVRVGGYNTKEEQFTPERLHQEGEKMRRLSLDLVQFAKTHFELPVSPDLEQALNQSLNIGAKGR